MTSCDISIQLEQMCQPLPFQPGQFYVSPLLTQMHKHVSPYFSGKGLEELMGLQRYCKCRWVCVLNWIARFDAETDCKL